MIIILLLIPALFLIYYYYRTTIPEIPKPRKALLFALRTISVIILLVLLFNPIFNFSRSVVSRPQVIFLTDNSYSMDLSAGTESKYDLLRNYRQQLEPEIRKNNYDLRDFTFAAGIEGTRTATKLTNTLQDMSERVNMQNIDKIFLFSDGWFNDDHLDIINRLNIPVWTIHPDYAPDEFDLGISTLYYNQTAYTEEENEIIVDIFADNYEDEAEISFYIDDRLVDKQRISFAEENIKQIVFSNIFDQAGLFPIRAEIEALEGDEHNRNNNIYPGAIRVLDKRSGVHILTDILNWDAGFINNALRRDERKDVKVIRQQEDSFLSGRDHLPFGDIFPDHLQMLILINKGKLTFSGEQVETIERFVNNGGGLLFIGNPLTEMEEILGARQSVIMRTFRTTIQFTPESRRYQTFADLDHNQVPTIEYLYVEPLLHSEILATFNNDERSPAILYNEYGQGRVLNFAFYNIWRWQLRGEGETYNEFIGNVASWLSYPSETNFIAMSDKNSYFLGENVRINLTAYDETLSIHRGLNPKIYLYDEEDQTVLEDFLSFDNRYYHISIDQLPHGNYSYNIIDEGTGNSTDGSFIVSNIDAERRNRGFNLPLLNYISRQTGGTSILEEDLPNLTFVEALPTIERRRYEIPLYRHWLVIALFLLAFCTELYLRKKWGLL